MKLSSKYMAYWVCVFVVVYLIDSFQLLPMVGIDERSLFFGLIIGFLLMKLAPPSAYESDIPTKEEQ